MDVTTVRLYIRDLCEADWPALHALRTNPEVYRYNHFGPESEEETRTWIRATMVHNNLTPRLSHNCSLVFRDTGQVIGWIGFGLPSAHKVRYSDISFGYALLPAFWNQGYMTEALQALLTFVFTTTDADSISDTCDVRNIGSARVMEKAGLRQVERFADCDDKTNQPTESYRYLIRRAEWEARNRLVSIPRMIPSARHLCAAPRSPDAPGIWQRGTQSIVNGREELKHKRLSARRARQYITANLIEVDSLIL